MPEPHAANGLGERLRPFQRRLQHALFIRTWPVACGATTAVGGAVAMLLHLQAMATAAAIAVGLAAGPAFALLVARSRRPSIGATAAAVDLRYRLSDLAVTALQFADGNDPVSRRLVADAASRLATLEPRLLDPPLPGRALWVGAAMLAVTAAAVTTAAPKAVAPGPDDGEANTVTAAGPPSRSDRTSASRPVLKPSVASGQTQGPAAGADVAARRDIDTSSAAAATTSPPAGQSVAVDARRDLPSPASSSASTDATAVNAKHAGEAASIEPAAAGASGAARGGGRDGAGGAGAGQAARSGRDAGGVANGAVTVGASRAPERGLAPRSIDATQYRRAVARAETAIAHQRVPPRLRSYVRNYFLAIRPAHDDADQR